MIIPPPIAAIAGAATAILSAASMTNMYETYALARESARRAPPPPVAWASADEAAAGLATLPRRELVALFLRCAPPAVAELGFADDDGAGWRYDGRLLDNGPILSPVTDFITNTLFGRGRRWLGKAYLAPSSSATGATAGIGKNRFARQPRQKSTAVPPDEVLDRAFDYALEPSALPSAAGPATSLFQRYAARCPASPLSPLWRGMVDELRAVPLAGDGPPVLLGMGYFAWSGGAWNPAPFCLVPRRVGREPAA